MAAIIFDAFGFRRHNFPAVEGKYAESLPFLGDDKAPARHGFYPLKNGVEHGLPACRE